MSRSIEPREFFDVYGVSPHPPRVDHIDGFLGMEAALDYLRANPDERAYVVTDVANAIRAVAFFSHGNLLLLTGGEGSDV